MATVSEAAINAAVQEIISLDCYCDYAYAFNIAKEYFQKHRVDIEEWLSTFNTEYEKTVKNPAPEPESVDDEIFVDDSDLFVDDAWVAEQEKVHALHEQEMHELRQRIFATPPEKFLKIIPFSKQSGQTVKPSGRQSGARKPARRSAAQKKAASNDGDGDGGDGEPPRPRPRSKQQKEQQPAPQQLPKFYTYAEFAGIFGITPESLRNAVSAGRFPKPHQTIFGPRFSEEHLNYALSNRNKAVTPQTRRHSPPPPAPARGRGRPRIAQSLGKGGAA